VMATISMDIRIGSLAANTLSPPWRITLISDIACSTMLEETNTTSLSPQGISKVGLFEHTAFCISRNCVSAARELALQKLRPAEMDASNRSECLPGTRQDVQNFISAWATDLMTEKKILWMYGLAGSGKSTLATTIANSFRDSGRLGAFIFFDRDVSESSRPGVVIRTLAYQLGSFSHHIGTAIATTIDSNPNIHASPLKFQFQKLLIQPLSSLTIDDMTNTIVVVVDALDECGNAKERKNLLELLANESRGFPSTFRMLITSRAEHDIYSAFESQGHIYTQELDITTPSNVTDISRYIHHRMMEIRRAKAYLPLEVDWPGDLVLDALCGKAVGLFVWASTATEFIDAHDPNKRIDALLSADKFSGVESALDALYKAALQSAAVWDDEDFSKDFRDILGIVLVAKAPLSSKAIDNLLGISETRPSMHTISLLRCVLAQNPSVRVLHPSFADFLANRNRCENEIWFIEVTSHNYRMAVLCLSRLDVVLRRNICNLSLSSAVSAEGDLADDITYACAFWIDHVLLIINTAASIADRIDQFLRRHLLHWLEAMSILKRSRETNNLLGCLLDWIHVSR
jgi:NACHT domain